MQSRMVTMFRVVIAVAPLVAWQDVTGMSRVSEIELINIFSREDERFSEQDVVSGDLNLAQPAGLDRIVAGPQGSLVQGARSVNRQIAQVHGVPEHNAIGDAFVDITFIVIRKAQTDDLDVAPARLLDGLGR